MVVYDFPYLNLISIMAEPCNPPAKRQLLTIVQHTQQYENALTPGITHGLLVFGIWEV